jgi:hypothetical protein
VTWCIPICRSPFAQGLRPRGDDKPLLPREERRNCDIEIERRFVGGVLGKKRQPYGPVAPPWCYGVILRQN